MYRVFDEANWGNEIKAMVMTMGLSPIYNLLGRNCQKINFSGWIDEKMVNFKINTRMVKKIVRQVQDSF